MTKKRQDFIPCLKEKDVGENVVYRTIKSWHSGTYGGEGLTKIPGSEDGSGCIKEFGGLKYQSQINTVTHRLYCLKGNDFEKTVSAFLSFPNGMGSSDEYFWEIYPALDGDIERFFGDNAEEDTIKVIEEE